MLKLLTVLISFDVFVAMYIHVCVCTYICGMRRAFICVNAGIEVPWSLEVRVKLLSQSSSFTLFGVESLLLFPAVVQAS